MSPKPKEPRVGNLNSLDKLLVKSYNGGKKDDDNKKGGKKDDDNKKGGKKDDDNKKGGKKQDVKKNVDQKKRSGQKGGCGCGNIIL